MMRRILRAARFRGLAAAKSANLSVAGNFYYGSRVVIAEGCNVIVPAGAMLRLGHDCYVGRYAELGPLGTITIGDRTSIQDRSILLGDVSIGRYCLLSLNVLMTSGTHYFDRWPHLLVRDQDAAVNQDPVASAAHSRKITVEDDCWIGMNAVIAPGVHVSRGSIIGANSVVTKNVKPYCVVAGVPARVIRKRLDFVPPSRISSRDLAQLPYFYSGFRLAKDEREEQREGYSTLERFAVWISPGPRKSISLRVRASASGTLTCESTEESRALSTGWNEYSFGLAHGAAPVWFHTDGATLAVSDVWAS